MRADLAVLNARVVLPETGPQTVRLIVNDIWVTALASLDAPYEADHIVNAASRIVLPGT